MCSVSTAMHVLPQSVDCGRVRIRRELRVAAREHLCASLNALQIKVAIESVLRLVLLEELVKVKLAVC